MYTSCMGTFCNFYQLLFVEYHLYMDFGLLDVYYYCQLKKAAKYSLKQEKK